jgi:hypothetical protein
MNCRRCFQQLLTTINHPSTPASVSVRNPNTQGIIMSTRLKSAQSITLAGSQPTLHATCMVSPFHCHAGLPHRYVTWHKLISSYKAQGQTRPRNTSLYIQNNGPEQKKMLLPLSNKHKLLPNL